MDRTTKNALTARINKLESILRSVMGAKDQTPQSDDSSHVDGQEFDGITESLGAMKVDKSNNTEYLGSSHWVSILAEVSFNSPGQETHYIIVWLAYSSIRLTKSVCSSHQTTKTTSAMP